MIFSILNSFDNERSYSSSTKTLPYYGLYESCANKKTIYIYCITERNDTLTIQYSNSKENDESNYITSESYNINNDEKKITLQPRLNYFRIYLTSTDVSYDSTYTRKINVYLSDSQILLTDTNGNLLTNTSGSSVSTDVNVINTPTVSISGTPTINFAQANTDAFGRLRMSHPYTLFDSSNVNYKNTKFSEYMTGGNPTPTHNISGSFVNLICNGSGTVVREGKTICSYQPGKSLLILNSFVMNSAQSGLTQRVGYFNDNNGIYLELTNSTLNIVKRSYSSGTVINTSISQSNWNTNTLTSGNIVLDITKPQIFWIDIEWLGVGSVRTGFIIDEQYYVCHIFKHSNTMNGAYGTYMTSARLSPRYEISYSGVGSSLGYTLKQICSTVISEGGYEARSIVRHIGQESAMINIPVILTSGFTPLIAIKLDDTSSVNINGIMVPSQLSLLYDTGNGNGNILYQILLNPDITATPSYTKYSTTYPSDTTSVASYWVNASGTTFTVSGGIVVNAGLLHSGNTIALSSPYDFNLQIGRNYGGNNTYTSDVLVLAVKVLAGQTPTNTILFAQLGWYEI